MRRRMLASVGGVRVPTEYGGLCFTAEAPNSSVRLRKVSSAPAISIVTSKDGVNWSDYTVASTGNVISLPNIGDKVYFAAGPNGNDTLGTSSNSYHNFVLTGSVAATGDITSLRDFNLTQTEMSGYCFFKLFSGCSGLTSAPKLPAVKLNSSSYGYMFYDCTGLTSMPELPATTFVGSHCCRYMFAGCTNITECPLLPATNLSVSSCFERFFSGCSKLASIRVKLTEWNVQRHLNWVNGVAETGTFYKPPSLPETFGVSYIPEGWTVVDETT